MVTHDPVALDRRIKHARTAFAKLGSVDDMDELLIVIHRPGWTTIAEVMLVESLLDTLTAQAQGMLATRQALMNASKRVGQPQTEAVTAS